MERIEQLKEIVKSVTDDTLAIDKYAAHLDALIEQIVPERISGDYISAINANNFEVACKVLAEHYRNKDSAAVPSLTANGRFDKASADRAIDGYAREVNIDWKFEISPFLIC